MKVKHFFANNGEILSLDDKINNFISDKKVTDIKYGISMTNAFTVCSALVMYEED